MGMELAIFLKAVIARVRNVRTTPFFLDGDEQILYLSCELLVGSGEGIVGVGKLGVAGNQMFQDSLIVDGCTVEIVECTVDLGKKGELVGFTFRCMLLVVSKVSGTKTITIASGSDSKLTLVVGSGILGFLGSPCIHSGVSVLPGFGGTREFTCDKDSFGGDSHKIFVVDGQLGTQGFQFGVLEFVDVL